ncbi:MAG TPA: hypothetical protein GX745_08520 [Clostridiales bacterium]|nr:hypothetical protein [Clostridiales bacterium]
MAIQSVQAYLNGTWYTLNHNSATGKYEATLTAPGTTSWHQPNNVYAMQIKATNTAGTVTTVDTTDDTVGNALKLRVLETVKPTINITSPGAGSYVTNNKQPIVFQLRDEAGGSGIKISSLALKLDGGSAIGNSAAGMVCNAVTNGYDCTYTPQTALSDGSHTVTINVSDNDGNAATQVSRTYTVDTVPPVLNVTSPANGFITNSAALVVQGTTNDATSSSVTVTIKLNGTDQGAVAVSGGAFTKSLTLANGSNTIVVRATDAAGKYSEVTITGTLDTSVPVISSVSITPNPADTGETMIISVEVVG